MSFYKTVLTVATVVFVIMLTITALMIKKSYGRKLYPPEIPKCPDKWIAKDDGSCEYNNFNPSDDSITKPFMYEPGTGDSYQKRKEKCRWAKDNNVLWEGIWDGIIGVKGC